MDIFRLPRQNFRQIIQRGENAAHAVNRQQNQRQQPRDANRLCAPQQLAIQCRARQRAERIQHQIVYVRCAGGGSVLNQFAAQTRQKPRQDRLPHGKLRK